jgi:hypothetical protein
MVAVEKDCVDMSVEDKLKALGVKGVLREMAERGQLLELVCEMPQCYCPFGRTHFERRIIKPFDWAPSVDHYPIIKSRDGKRYAENVRLAHVLCNERDQTLRRKISDMLRMKNSLQDITDALNAMKAATLSGGFRWSPATVRRMFVS